MEAEERRREILKRLAGAEKPVSAAKLAEQFSVSRQIIVGDVALLRASGHAIEATPRGYILRKPSDTSVSGIIRRIASKHTAAEMQDELYAIVDQGCTVIDVIVEHPIYGQLTGALQLRSRYDVDQFTARCAASDALPLSFLTEGIHLHTLQCPDVAAFERVKTDLREKGYLLE